MRDYPRVALVSTWTNSVVASYDRVRCGSVEDWTIPKDTSNWPAESIVVVDVETNAVVDEFAVDRDGVPR